MNRNGFPTLESYKYWAEQTTEAGEDETGKRPQSLGVSINPTSPHTPIVPSQAAVSDYPPVAHVHRVGVLETRNSLHSGPRSACAA